MASGFLSGEQQGDGRYIVRERHKHVWTEVYFPAYGWIPFDATEGAQEIKSITQNSTNSRAEGWRWLFNHGPIPPLMLTVVLVIAGYLIKTELLPRLGIGAAPVAAYAPLPPTNQQIAAAYRSACDILGSRGYERYAYETPSEFLDRMYSSLPISETSNALKQLTSQHAIYVYGSTIATEADVAQSKQALSILKATARSLKRVSAV